MNNQLRFIGRVHSTLKNLCDCPLQEHEGAPEAEIEIFPEFLDAMKDIAPGQHLVLLTWLHQADRSVLATRPRNDDQAPITGVFSTRSPDRPNPLGMHRVQVISVSGSRIHLSGLETLDGTPVVDVKVDLVS